MRIVTRLAVRAAIVVAALTVAWLLIPKPTLYGDVTFSTVIDDRNGELLRLALADDERYRVKANLADIAPAAVQATLLYEDRHFRSHLGFNPAALLRAAWSTYVVRQRVVGGSTITMQLSRLRFDLDTTTIGGKLVQIARAIQLERHYSKDDILEAYLNLAPYGGNIEGLATAARIYFDKRADELTLPEALALVVIPQNPAQRNPQTAVGYAAMRDAQVRLFEIWRDKYGASTELAAHFRLPLAVRSTPELPFLAPHTTERLLHSAPPAEHIAATVDINLQRVLEQRLADYVERHRGAGIDNAAAMLVDTRTMDVLAEAGSVDFFNAAIAGQVNGTRAKRSPGSTLKPFVYALALDQGLIHPMSLLKDAPRRFAAYTPENFDRGFLGPITARDALIYSRNVPAIELLNQIGTEPFNAFLGRAGVANLQSAEHYGLSMVLGGNEATMSELVGLYAMLANAGVSRPLRRELNAPLGAAERLLSREASFLALDMLRANPRPDALAFAGEQARTTVAWKTGTSYAYRDAWSVGIVGPYALAVWVGHFDGRSNPALVGRRAAAPLFFAIVDQLAAGLPAVSKQSVPPVDLNLAKIDVCAPTGDLPGRYCPRTTKSWFIPGVSPIRVSNVHRAVAVDSRTGARSCAPGETTRTEVYEFWPSDLLRLYRQAGIAVRSPPPWAPDCGLDVRAATGVQPEITSPLSGTTVLRTAAASHGRELPLTATTDADARWLYWFANDRFLAKVDRDEPLLWEPESGEYRLVAVDDLGRSGSASLTVAAVP
ncbi:MAG: penicillin-binding protein 1C [Pseudomonadota bacterium]